MNKSKVDEALQEFLDFLPDKPLWVAIVSRSGEFIARSGDYPHRYAQPVNDELAGQWIQAYGLQQLDILDKLSQGNLQYSLSVGSGGILFLVHLNDAYFLAMSLVDLKSFDALVEAMQANFGGIIDALYFS
jgi:hypothetical protein